MRSATSPRSADAGLLTPHRAQTVQALRSCVGFTSAVAANAGAPSVRPWCSRTDADAATADCDALVGRPLAELLAAMRRAEADAEAARVVVDPAGFLSALVAANPTFVMGQQHDAQEFLRFLVGTADCGAAAASVTQLFDGSVAYTTTCTECQAVPAPSPAPSARGGG